MDVQKGNSLIEVQNDRKTSGVDVAYVYGKIERIVKALYAVSELFPSREPMRWTFRKQGLSLLRKALFLKRTRDGANVIDSLTEIVSYLSIAQIGGLISEMNADIIKEEVANVIGLLDKNSISPVKEALTSKGQKTSLPYTHFQGEPSNSSSKTSGSSTDTKNNNSKGQSDMSDRKKSIVELAKEKGSITISDVSEVITEVSEKTLQRDLKSLVKSGKLERKGKRRWTRYYPV